MSKKTLQVIIDQLSTYLADSYVLYVKTQNFHWNMEGSEFYMYHKLLQEQYESLAEAVDELAERIRQLGSKAPGSMKAFLKIATLKESSEKKSMKEMIKELTLSHEHLVNTGEKLIAYCDENGDPGTSDMIVGRIREHAKQAWLLRSHIT